MRLRAVLAVVTLAIALGMAVSAEAGVRTPDGSVTAAGADGFDFAQPEVVATGLEAPWGLDFLPDGSALVAQRNQGTVLRVRPGQPTVQVARIAGVVGGGEEACSAWPSLPGTAWTGGSTSASPPRPTSGSRGSG